jgi:Integrase core domain
MGNDTTANKLCDVLEQAIDWLGPPATLVSDNGPPFNSWQLKQFYSRYGIDHLTTAPYHPASNGIAERFVRSFKEGIIKQQRSGQTDKSRALRNILRSYRWTPHSTTGVAPAEMLFSRSIRTELARLKPATKISRRNPTKFNPGQLVWIANTLKNKGVEWKPGTIQVKIGSMMYKVNLEDGLTGTRHQNQLRARYSSSNQTLDLDPLPDDLLNHSGTTNKDSTSETQQQPTTQQQQPTAQQQQQTPRYPQRIRKPPERYSPP